MAQAVVLAGLCDVLVDFSPPSALPENLAAARAANTPIVIGTTGLEAQHHALIDAAAAQVAVLQAANTSLGVNLIGHLVREAAARLGPDWEIEVLEMHHSHKVDAQAGPASGRASRRDRVCRTVWFSGVAEGYKKRI